MNPRKLSFASLGNARKTEYNMSEHYFSKMLRIRILSSFSIIMTIEMVFCYLEREKVVNVSEVCLYGYFRVHGIIYKSIDTGCKLYSNKCMRMHALLFTIARESGGIV